MKSSVVIPYTLSKVFLVYVFLQTSLFLRGSAGQNSTDNSTTIPITVSPLNGTLNSTMAPSGNSVNTTGTNSTNTTLVSCQMFSCNYSACYNTFLSTNITTCSATENYCELRRDGDMLYSVRCTSSCLSACTNTSQNNCSISCCTDNCLNTTLNNLLNSSLIMTTTTAPTTTATTAKVSTVATTTTMATNGKKCHKLSCNGDTCYQGNTNVVLCSPGQNFCMLKKTPTVTWTASCIEDCSKEIVCTSSNNNCILECCNATTTASCLKLNGQVNVVGSGAMTPCFYMPLVVSSFFLWLLMMGKTAG
ncbi:uncharacterized protein LOC124383942 [Silurus meridionalis]|nr:uncharacterized protein LOC124383942 [Silurus meridionalis]